MTTRRAVSPVIATVILIAVAVALGIAVAVWAGALTGGLQKQEKLIINAFQGTVGAVLYVNITVTNQSPGAITVTQVLFNQQPIPSANINMGGLFTVSGANFVLASGATGTLGITSVNAGNPKSGITYPITVVTAAGNSYPSTLTWP